MNKTYLKYMLLATVIVMDILGGAEMDLFVPSFPELKAHFNLSTFWLEALLSYNFLGYCFSLFFVGSLSDKYGRKPIILLGLIVFIIGSCLCSWGGLYNFVLLGRFLQGVGVAAPATLCYLIIADSYPLKQQQYLMGILNGLMNVAVAGAPVLGSYITMYFHWQGNFIALLILGVLALLMTIFFIPKTKLPEHKESLSLRGYIPILKSKPLMLLVIHIVFLYVPYWVFLGMASILYMEDLGVSLAQFGYYQGAWALVFALGSIFSAPIINKYGQKQLLYVSWQICVISLGIIALITYLDIKNPLIIALSFLPLSIGGIIPNVILYPIALNFMPQLKGRVSALIRMVMLILNAVGIEIAGYFYQGSFQVIGIILIFFIIIAVISLFYIIKNKELMKFS
jgi:DHA1 family bicyclomycin/chloramphenicol resistance-like MFS transporter